MKFCMVSRWTRSYYVAEFLSGDIVLKKTRTISDLEIISYPIAKYYARIWISVELISIYKSANIGMNQ